MENNTSTPKDVQSDSYILSLLNNILLEGKTLIQKQTDEIRGKDLLIVRLKKGILTLSSKILERETKCKQENIRFRSYQSLGKDRIGRIVKKSKIKNIVGQKFDKHRKTGNQNINQNITIDRNTLSAEISDVNFPGSSDFIDEVNPLLKTEGNDISNRNEFIVENDALYSTEFYFKHDGGCIPPEIEPVDQQNPTGVQRWWRKIPEDQMRTSREMSPEVLFSNDPQDYNYPKNSNEDFYEKLHAPLEAKERRRKKREAQRIRELSVVASLTEKQNNRNRSTNEATSAEKVSEISTFDPDYNKLNTILFTNGFPVMFLHEPLRVTDYWNQVFTTPWRHKFEFQK